MAAFQIAMSMVPLYNIALINEFHIFSLLRIGVLRTGHEGWER